MWSGQRASTGLLNRSPPGQAQESSAIRDSISAKAASSAARRTGLDVRSERMRSRCKSSSCLCRSRLARSNPSRLVASRTAPEAVRSADDCCSSTDLLSQPRAIYLWYVIPRAAQRPDLGLGALWRHGKQHYPGNLLFQPAVSWPNRLKVRKYESLANSIVRYRATRFGTTTPTTPRTRRSFGEGARGVAELSRSADGARPLQP